jgi:hypothetical protein
MSVLGRHCNPALTEHNPRKVSRLIVFKAANVESNVESCRNRDPASKWGIVACKLEVVTSSMWCVSCMMLERQDVTRLIRVVYIAFRSVVNKLCLEVPYLASLNVNLRRRSFSL